MQSCAPAGSSATREPRRLPSATRSAAAEAAWRWPPRHVGRGVPRPRSDRSGRQALAPGVSRPGLPLEAVVSLTSSNPSRELRRDQRLENRNVARVRSSLHYFTLSRQHVWSLSRTKLRLRSGMTQSEDAVLCPDL